MEAQSIKIAAGKDEGECSRWGGEVANGNDDAEGRTETEKGEGEAKNSKNNSSSMMLGLLEEFTKIYADRLQRVEDTAMKCEEKQYLANKVCVLEGWVRDLGEQNSVLVVTVEELEREAACRVALLEDKLSKMAVTTRQSCLSLRDHQIQVTSLVRDKVGLENEAQGLREKLLSLEQRNTSLMEENTNLHSDLSNLLQVITRARQTGQWELDDLTFSCVTPEQVFGPVLSSSRRSSTSLKEIQSDYFHHLVEDQGLKKGSSSLASSFSNLQDAESSTYGGRGSEKDLMIMKLRAEVHNLQSAQEQANRHLVERDKQIADLQTQLTQNHQVLSTAHSEINNGKLGLTEVHHQSRKGNVEIELSNNIDSLIIRLREVENECRGLRDTNRSLQNTHQSLQDEHRTLQDSHTCCSSVVTTLQDQLAKSHETFTSTSKTQIIDEDTNKLPVNGMYSSTNQPPRLSKLENEVAEKSVLLRELQSHLAASRQELHLKDETLFKLEQKLDNSRRDGSEKRERMQYLTGQLTNLQLEVGRTHGQVEQLRRQVENKTDLIRKLEVENSSMTQQLNEKSNTLERYQTQLMNHSSDLDKKKREVCEQRLTISALQDALVSSKRACDQLRCRLDPDMSGREGEAERLEKDLREAQSLHHHTFSQLVESGAQQDLLREENRALSQHLTTLQGNLSHKNDQHLKVQVEEANVKLMQTVKERERYAWEKEDLSRQLHEAEARQEELVTSLRLLQGQVQMLEEEVTSSSEGRIEAERRVKEAEQRVKDAERREKEAERNNRLLQDKLIAQETSESVEFLGQQLEATVAALSVVQEEARSKGEQIRKARQDAEQLSGALAYEKDLSATLHNQVEGLARETATQEGKVGELQQELRRMARVVSHKEKEVRANEAEVVGLKRQVGVLEGLLEDGQRELASLRDTLASQDTLRKDVRTKLQAARKEAVRSQGQVTELRSELREAHEHIETLEHQIKNMDEEREAEVGAVVERLTISHDQSIRRLEASLLTYSRVYDHDHNQVEGLEESLAEVGEKLGEAERQLREARQERDSLARNLRQERTKRQEEGRGHYQQVHKLTEEISLLKARLESVQEESGMWQKQCEDLEERHSLLDATATTSPFPLVTTITATSLLAQLAKMQQQMEGLREAVTSATEEKRTAEEERGHAHEQVLSLIRECNALEEQIHRLTKEKCQLEEKVSARESDLTVAHENMRSAKKDHNLKEEKLNQLKEELIVVKMEGKREEPTTSTGRQEPQQKKVCGDKCSCQREASELRRLLIERDTQARVTQLRITTLQRSLQDHQNEVSQLEERLHEEQTHGQKKETEVAGLRTQVATLSTQLAHAQARSSLPLPATHRVESLESKVFDLKGELAAREEQLKQAVEHVDCEVRRNKNLQQEVARLRNSRDDAMQQVAVVENALAETHNCVEDSQAMKLVWETQLKSIKEEVARLMCETGQLKDCNAALHEQLSASQCESKTLQCQMRERDTQLEEVQQARDLLANDAQVVVAAVRQWLHEQKLTNAKLAGKLHQQNKQILLLNTEKQFLAERNTNLQRTSHDLTLQVHELRARLSLPLSPTPSENMGKVGGVVVMGGCVTSPRVMSPTMGMSPHILPGTPTPDNLTHFSSLYDCKLEDITSTCSLEGNGGCNVPGPDLPGTLKLGHLAQLADSLLAASRNISSSSGVMQCRGARPVLTSTTSLGDLTSPSNTFSKFEDPKRTSISVGNLSSINSPDVRDRATSPISIYGDSRGISSRTGGLSMTPVREKRTMPPILSSHSIEEAEDEGDGGCDV